MVHILSHDDGNDDHGYNCSIKSTTEYNLWRIYRYKRCLE